MREKIINRKEATKKINELYPTSSLFITKDLVKEIIKAMDEFKK